MKTLNFLFLSLLFVSCQSELDVKSLDGKWVFDLDVQGSTLPIKIEFTNGKGVLHNSIERITLDEIKAEKDRFIIPLSIYPNYFELKPDGNVIRGHWVKLKKGKEERLSIVGARESSFKEKGYTEDKDANRIRGKWKVDFYNNGEKEKTGLATFRVEKKFVRGTIITETGDYRFLEGNFMEGELYLQGFDGQYAFVVKGKLDKGKLSLDIFGGKTWRRKLEGFRDANFELRDPETLTQVKGEGKIKFVIEDLEGKSFTESDQSLKGKPYLIQIFGSWCPNCLDEAKFLNAWKEKTMTPMPIVAIGFERAANKKMAINHIKRKIDKLGLKYTFYLGSHDKDEKGVLEVLPFLKNHLSYPTLIFVNKKGVVHKIHTGFNGPATGHYFQKYVYRFVDVIRELEQ